MPIKTVKEVYTDVGGNTTIEYLDDSTTKFNIADTVTANTNPVTGGISSLAAGGRDALADMGVSYQISRWRKKLATDPANAKLAILGDSTSDASTSAVSIYNALKNIHTRHGEALEGMVGDDAHIMPFGYNGSTLAAWLANTTQQAALWAAAPDLIIFGFGINDVRLGLTSKAQLIVLMETAIQLIKTNLPNCDILLRMPNSFLTTNVGGLNYVQSSGGTINPAGAAQTYSTILRDAYLSFERRYSYVEVIDMQAKVFGTVARSTHTLMADQLHPTTASSTLGTAPIGGGYVAVAEALAACVGRGNSSFVLDTKSYKSARMDFIVVSGGNGFVDIGCVDANAIPASQYPVTIADLLFIESISDPISLASATISRPFGGANIRILIGGTDFTSTVGYRAGIGLTHAGPTTNDRQVVSVDLPSIATTATVAQTVTVTGARTGDLSDATAVICTPPAAFNSAGLRLIGCYPTANDTVTLIVNNPTGGAVDLVASNFTFWLVR